MTNSVQTQEGNIEYAIVGCGAIGLGLAHLLKDASCTLLTRDARYSQFEVMDAYGSSMPIYASRQTLEETKNWQHYDLLILPVKFYQLPSLLASIKDVIPDSLPLLLLQNGMGGHELVAKACPDNPIYVASTTDGIVKLSPKSICINARGELLIGSLNTKRQLLSIRFLLAAHPNARWDEDIERSLYKKLAVNAVINPISAKYACKNGLVREHAEVFEALKQEVLLLYRQMALGLDLIAVDNYIEAVIDNTYKNESSMLQDIKHQRPTEIDGILGTLLEKARELQLALPTMSGLYADIKALERTYQQ